MSERFASTPTHVATVPLAILPADALMKALSTDTPYRFQFILLPSRLATEESGVSTCVEIT
jgi:hypothetical protein